MPRCNRWGRGSRIWRRWLSVTWYVLWLCLFWKCDCSVLRLSWTRPAVHAYPLAILLHPSCAMKRTPSRAPSPTPTAFSGISNYRTESYRPRDLKGAPAVPTIDYRQVSKIHYGELGKYLASYLAAGACYGFTFFYPCLTGVVCHGIIQHLRTLAPMLDQS